MRQGCVMSPRLFSICLDGVIKEVRGMLMYGGSSLTLDGKNWMELTCLYSTDDTIFLVGSEKDLQRSAWELNLDVKEGS